MSIELVEVLDLSDGVNIDFGVLRDVVDMSLEQIPHVLAHGSRVNVAIEPGSLQG